MPGIVFYLILSFCLFFSQPVFPPDQIIIMYCSMFDSHSYNMKLIRIRIGLDSIHILFCYDIRLHIICIAVK